MLLVSFSSRRCRPLNGRGSSLTSVMWATMLSARRWRYRAGGRWRLIAESNWRGALHLSSRVSPARTDTGAKGPREQLIVTEVLPDEMEEFGSSHGTLPGRVVCQSAVGTGSAKAQRLSIN